MRDPLDNFFDTDRQESNDVSGQTETDVSMGPIEEAAITEDVTLVRETLRKAITDAARRLPDFLDLASQMQEPEMIDSASKMLTALSKLSSDLINIDLRVLVESKKIAGRTATVSPTTVDADSIPVGQRVVTEATTADVLRIMREADRANEASVEESRAKYADSQPPAR